VSGWRIAQVRFFIVVNKQEVRTIEDLRANFHAQDVLSLYQNGVLARWLEALGEIPRAERLKTIDQDNLDTKGILRQLCAAFDIEDHGEIDGVTCYIDFLQKNAKEIRDLHKKLRSSQEECIGEYHKQYSKIKSQILSTPDDMHFLKVQVDSLANRFLQLLYIDFKNMVQEAEARAPMVLLLFIANQKIRNCIEEIERYEFNKLRTTVHKKIKDGGFDKFIPGGDLDSLAVGKTYIKAFQKDTDASWDDIEPDTSRQFLVLSIPEGCKVRDKKSSKNVEDRIEITPGKVHEFIVLNGIEYNSKTASSPLVYMEV
jgi:hypothetical protein